MCRPLTRRELLRYGALVAATFPTARLLRDDFSLSGRAFAAGPAVPTNLELVTVSDTVAVMTWLTADVTDPDEFGRPRPIAAPGRVLIGTSPDPSSWEVVGEHDATPYHYVEVRDLTPGTTYYWRAESAGVPATSSAISLPNAGLAAPPSFSTLIPPPGRELGTVAWLNDLHIGEMTSGLAYGNSALPGGGFPPGFAVDPDNPYWRFMAQACVRESRTRGATLMLANGDLTSEAEPPEVAEARAALDAFGRLGGPRALSPSSEPAYFVTRGNHDRLHSGAKWEDCSAAGELRDCYRDAFASSFDPGTGHFSVSLGDDRARYRFVGLDSTAPDGTGVMTDDELSYLSTELDRGDATFVLCHHGASDLATTLAVPPVVFGIERNSQAKLRSVLGGADNVAAVYNAHTHRNLRTTATDTGSLPFFEGGAVKEYPGGYTTVRLFEGGYLVNFWRVQDPEARAWVERSRGEYLGLYPYYTLGSLSDRNWARAMDARVTTGPGASPSPTASPTPRPGADKNGSNGGLPATGGAAALAVAAAAAATAATATVTSTRRAPDPRES